jgi:hypothetical protein
VIWVDIDVASGDAWPEWGDGIAAMNLPGFRREMVAEKLVSWMGSLDPGDVPRFDRPTEEPGRASPVRALMAEALYAKRKRAQAPEVNVQPVFFLCGESWLITCSGLALLKWERELSGRVGGKRLSRDIDYARRHWQRSFESGDLATLFLRRIVESWLPAISRLDDYLQELGRGFLLGLEESESYGAIDDRKYRAGLLAAQLMVNGISQMPRRLSRPAKDPSRAWFPAEQTADEAAAVQQLIERADQMLASQREEIRAAFTLLAAVQTSDQLRLAQETQKAAEASRKRSEAVQATVDVIAAALLVPTLVAGFFAAVPDFPAWSDALRTLLVGATMVLLGLVSYLGLRQYRSRQRQKGEPAEAQPTRLE